MIMYTDHRPSGEHLSFILEQALIAMKSSYDNLGMWCALLRTIFMQLFTAGILTTPQLHYMVWSRNADSPPSDIEDYYHKISTAFTKLLPKVSEPALCE